MRDNPTTGHILPGKYRLSWEIQKIKTNRGKGISPPSPKESTWPAFSAITEAITDKHRE
jgi:hypothetical protein